MLPSHVSVHTNTSFALCTWKIKVSLWTTHQVNHSCVWGKVNKVGKCCTFRCQSLIFHMFLDNRLLRVTNRKLYGSLLLFFCNLKNTSLVKGHDVQGLFKLLMISGFRSCTEVRPISLLSTPLITIRGETCSPHLLDQVIKYSSLIWKCL